MLGDIRTKCGTLQKAGGAPSATLKDVWGRSVPAGPCNVSSRAGDVAAGSCQYPASQSAGLGWWQRLCRDGCGAGG